MKRIAIVALSVLLLAGLTWALFNHLATEQGPQLVPVPLYDMPEPQADAMMEADPEEGEPMDLGIAPRIEFAVPRVTQEESGEGLYQDLRDAVDSIPRADNVEFERINPSLTLPALPTPTIEDTDDDEPEPEPIP